MFATDRSRDWQPSPRVGSVPTLLQRAGDFSQTLNSAGSLWTIYDPEFNYPNPN